jgi:hypothetical protein
MHDLNELPKEERDLETLRSIFNKSDYPTLIEHRQLKHDEYPKHIEIMEKLNDLGEEYCLSSVIRIFRSAKDIWWAEVHAYVRENGSLAASGKWDPKKFILNGRMYKLKKSSK